MINLGIVGAGFINQVAHIPHYAANPDCKIIGLAEIRPRLGYEVCERWNIPNLYNHHTELLKNPDIDAVLVVVRRHHTASIAMDVIKAKKALMTEKPMAQTYAQCKELLKESLSNKTFYSVGFMRRYDPTVNWVKNKLKELTSTNELGAILSVRSYLSAGGDYCNIGGEIKSDEIKPMDIISPIAPNFLNESLHKEFEHFVNVCGHDINLLRYLFPGCEIIPKHFEYKKNRGAFVILDMGDFSTVFEWSDTLQPKKWDEGVEIRFEKGFLKLELVPAFLRNCPSSATLYIDSGKNDGHFYSPRHDWEWAFENEDYEFIHCLKNSIDTKSMAYDCVNDMKLIENIWKLR